MSKSSRHAPRRERAAMGDEASAFVNLSLRLPADLARKLQDYETYLRRINPGVPITRSGAVRALLERGLLEFERAAAKKPRRDRLRRKPVGPGTPW